MGFAMRLRRLVVHGIFIGVLALTVVVGFGAHDASAAKSVGVSCATLYDTAIYVGKQSVAARERGDTATADVLWGLYTSLERGVVTSGCLDRTSGDSAA